MKEFKKILRLKQVLKYLSISKSSVYRNIENGTFPKQIRITERCVGWYEDDIKAYLDNLNGENA